MKIKYKFEEYRDLSFPVYSSLQKNKEILIQPHFHEDIEVVKVLSGQITVYADTKKCICKAGDIILFLPKTVHKVTSDTKDASIQGLVFNPSILKEKICFSQTCQSSYIFNTKHALYDELNTAFEKATKTYQNVSPAYKLEMTARLLILTSLLIRCDIISSPIQNPDNIRLQPVIDYIEHHYNQKITTCELANILCVCEDHLIRIFKEATSKTPSEYITDFRISIAMKMLVCEKYSLSEISQMTGFSNQCYFSKVFKVKTGLTPTEYKRKH